MGQIDMNLNSDELCKFYEERIAGGRLIDPATANIICEWVDVIDPYGVIVVPREAQCVGRVYFSRAPERDVWVSEYDLPAATHRDMRLRLDAGNYDEQLDCFP
jgi:hypothetical protein